MGESLDQPGLGAEHQLQRRTMVATGLDDGVEDRGIAAVADALVVLFGTAIEQDVPGAKPAQPPCQLGPLDRAGDVLVGDQPREVVEPARGAERGQAGREEIGEVVGRRQRPLRLSGEDGAGQTPTGDRPDRFASVGERVDIHATLDLDQRLAHALVIQGGLIPKLARGGGARRRRPVGEQHDPQQAPPGWPARGLPNAWDTLSPYG